MPDRVLVEILVAAPIDTVWKAISEPAQVQRWFGWEYPNLVSDIQMMWENNKLDLATHTMTAEGMPDRFELEPDGDRTIVRIIRSAPADQAGWQGIYEDTFEGWLTFIQQLKFFLERHPRDARRTIFLNGRAQSASTPHPIDAAGLAPLWVVPVGERYEVKTAIGDTLTGTVFYRGSYQIGLTVDSFGDGLLIPNIRPKTAKSPHGGGQILITTYGLDDAAVAALRDRWAAWWKKTYEVIEIV